jgi:2'-5' RNA ligase
MEVITKGAWRIFCAIELPDPARNLVLQHIAQVQAAVPDGRASWSRAANLHLTIKFLGEMPQRSVADLSSAAARAVGGLAPFSLCLERTGAFPVRGRPRILWLGISDNSGQLNSLHARLEHEAALAGFARDERPFQPHLTIARLRQPQHALSLAAAHRQLKFGPAEIAVSELLVIRSEFGSSGSKYSVVTRHPLAPR